MNVLILGGGGREHALGYKVSKSNKLNELFFMPGNAGTASIGQNITGNPVNFEEVKEAVLTRKIQMVVVGPEAPLVEGITDFFLSDPKLKDIFVIGPDKVGAQLEGSKDFAKRFMQKNNIPTARYGTFTKDNMEEASDFLKTTTPPYVLKADGLAAGKGVLIIDDLNEALRELEEMFSGKFGEASEKVVIEEFLNGIEVSVFVLTDGQNYVLLPEAKDYKRVSEGDKGLNTGGMGSVSPVPFADNEFLTKVKSRIIDPTMDGLQRIGARYKGFVFLGLMNVQGDPYVIEYNVRLGDPEAEAVLPRVDVDLLDLLEGVAEGDLRDRSFQLSKKASATVILASGGYPEKYEKGKVISGLKDVRDQLVFHAGTKKSGDDIVTSGGRVLAITGMAESMDEAIKSAYAGAGKIEFDQKYFRKDIGFDIL